MGCRRTRQDVLKEGRGTSRWPGTTSSAGGLAPCANSDLGWGRAGRPFDSFPTSCPCGETKKKTHRAPPRPRLGGMGRRLARLCRTASVRWGSVKPRRSGASRERPPSRTFNEGPRNAHLSTSGPCACTPIRVRTRRGFCFLFGRREVSDAHPRLDFVPQASPPLQIVKATRTWRGSTGIDAESLCSAAAAERDRLGARSFQRLRARRPTTADRVPRHVGNRGRTPWLSADLSNDGGAALRWPFTVFRVPLHPRLGERGRPVMVPASVPSPR